MVSTESGLAGNFVVQCGGNNVIQPVKFALTYGHSTISDKRMNIRCYLYLFLVCQSVTASASPVQSPESDKLIRDVDHLVQVAEQTNWHIDTEELKSLRTDILLVLCPASDALRQESLRFSTRELRDMAT